MSEDFRDLLVEGSRSERFGRFFNEINIRHKFGLSIQASDAHACEPFETLDDLTQYVEWEVAISQRDRPILQPDYGAWERFKDRPWAAKFSSHMGDAVVGADFVPTETVQQIYEDLLEDARKNP